MGDRSRNRGASAFGWPCPEDPSHGRLLDGNWMPGRPWYCPHRSHRGEQFYSTEQVEAANAARRAAGQHAGAAE